MHEGKKYFKTAALNIFLKIFFKHGKEKKTEMHYYAAYSVMNIAVGVFTDVLIFQQDFFHFPIPECM